MLPHRWDISPKEAIALQRQLAGLIRIEPLSAPVRLIAGCDCAFIGSHRTAGRVLAVAVLCDARTMEVVASAQEIAACTFPYVPGLLSFREAPAVIAAVAGLPQRPDLLMCDGQGIAHPRRLGLAAHVGLLMDMPSIGVAKSRLCGEHRIPALRRGSRTQLRDGGEVVGACLRTRDHVKPLYISPGHRITLDESIRLVLNAARNARLPEPTRQAHHLVTLLKNRLTGAG